MTEDERARQNAFAFLTAIIVTITVGIVAIATRNIIAIVILFAETLLSVALTLALLLVEDEKQV